MGATHRRLTQLHMAIRRSFGSAKRDDRAVGAGRSHKANLMAGISTSGDFESARKELECAVCDTPISDRRAFHSFAKTVVGKQGREIATGQRQRGHLAVPRSDSR